MESLVATWRLSSNKKACCFFTFHHFHLYINGCTLVDFLIIWLLAFQIIPLCEWERDKEIARKSEGEGEGKRERERERERQRKE